MADDRITYIVSVSYLVTRTVKIEVSPDLDGSCDEVRDVYDVGDPVIIGHATLLYSLGSRVRSPGRARS